MKPIFSPRVIAVFLVIGLFYVACDKDQEAVEVLTTNDVEGTYKGIMYVNQIEDFDTEIVNEMSIASVVEENTIYFSDFPVYTIIAAIEYQESLAEEISESLVIPYEINFLSDIIQEQSRIRISLDPQPLRFSYSISEGDRTVNKDITVFYTTSIKTSGYSSGKLFISMIAEEVQVNNKPLFIFAEQYLMLNMVKTIGI